MKTTQLEPRLQKLVDMGESGTDILHGELKNLIYEAETEYIEIEKEEREGGYRVFRRQGDMYTQWE